MRHLLFFYFISFTFFSFGQKESNFWYFGRNAGIDFNSGLAVADSGSLFTSEGCSAISDPISGDLLFYTDGITVYDANHDIMPNGVGLFGHSSSTQSSGVISKPGSSNVYCIFTLGAISASQGFNYTEVDMSLNGGLGDVNTVFNQSIYPNAGERMAIIQHQNGIDFWIVIEDYNTDGFKSFLFTASGFSGTGVNSLPGVLGSISDIGYLKANVDGDRLAVALYYGDLIKVFDFDNSSGMVSNTNPIELDLIFAYGVEFSPSGDILYGSEASGFPVTQVYQYDLNAGSSADIMSSQVLLDFSSSAEGALQLAPDGKIYLSHFGSSFLGVISEPDIIGLGCNYVQNGFELYPGTVAFYGFPVFRNNVTFNDKISNICFGDSIILENLSFDNPNWALENNPTDIISTDSVITVSPTDTTNYILFYGNDTIVYTVNVVPTLELDLGPDICDTTGVVTLDVFQPDLTYLWSNDSTISSIDVTETGIYWVEITNEVCTARDSIFIQFEEISIESPVLVECDSVVSLLANDSNAISGYWTYLGPPGSIGLVNFSPDSVHKNPTVTVPVLGEYIFTYTSDCGNEVSQTIEFVSKEPVLEIETIVQCDFEIDLIANSPVIDGFWSVTNPSGESADIADINSATTTATVTGYGLYTFTFTYDFCEASFSQTVDIQSVTPTITTDTTLFVCELEMTLSADVLGHTEGWQVLRGPGILNFSNVAGENTLVTVSDYGEYEISFEGCGGSDTIIIRFEKSKPSITSPEYVDCGLQALIEVDYVGESGIWSVEPENDEILQFDSQDSTQAILTSDRYGSAIVKYTICDSSVSRRVVFMCELDIPNVFTPNNDAYNHSFVIPRLSSTYYSKSKFTVFNRWGVPVYTNGEYGLHNSWWKGNTNNGGGKQLSEGVYFYELNLYNKVKQREENYKGTVHLFR